MKIGRLKIQSPFKFEANHGVSSSGSWSGLWGQLLTRLNSSKETVNPDTSLQLSAYYAAIRNISEDIAKQPIEVIERKKNGDIEILIDDPIQHMLAIRPNAEMTPITLIETLTAHCLGWGNGYAWIRRNGQGEPVELYPIHPSRVQVERDEDGEIFYKIFTVGRFCVPMQKRANEPHEIIMPEDMIHIKGLGGDGLCGYSVVYHASESLGSAIAAQKFSGSFFGNGTYVSGFLKHPNTLSKEAQDNLIKSMEERSQGAGKAHKLQVLEEGMEWQSTTVNPRDAQLVELRKFQVTDVARWFRMPPTKIGDFERATFSNIEHTNIDYNTDTLTPWATKWEQELKIKLFLDRKNVFVRFNENALLRGDSKTRAERDKMHWEIGVKSANEIRHNEGLNSYEGGDKRYRPLNYAEIGAAPEPAEETEVIDPMPENAIDMRPIVTDAVARLCTKEEKAVSRKASNDMSETERAEWAKKFYKQQYEHAMAAIEPIFKAQGKEIDADLRADIADLYLQQVEAFVNDKKVTAIDGKLTERIIESL